MRHPMVGFRHCQAAGSAAASIGVYQYVRHPQCLRDGRTGSPPEACLTCKAAIAAGNIATVFSGLRPFRHWDTARLARLSSKVARRAAGVYLIATPVAHEPGLCREESMRKSVILLGACTGLVAFAAQAQVPQLSGSYALILDQTCQATIAVTQNPTGGDLTSVFPNNNGSIEKLIGTATFNVSAGTVTINDISDTGSQTIWQEPTGTVGSAMAEASGSLSGPYSNTATTLTIGSKVLNVVYGNIVNGVANYLTLLALKPPNCTMSGTAQHQ
jgi:hypothetical protein